MLYVTGDLHGGDTAYHVTSGMFRPAKKGDVVLCTGDFGGVWHHDVNTNEKHKRDEEYFLTSKLRQRVQWLTVDGNHENFARLFSGEFPLVDLYSGKAYQIRKNVFYLKRGEVYTISGQTFLAFGGATSHDKDPFCRRTCYRTERWPGRTEGVNWWPEEVPSEADVQNAHANLDKYNWEVDHVITHTCPISIREHFVPKNTPETFRKLIDPVEVMLQNFLDCGLKFKHWHFGHFHFEQTFKNFKCYYDTVRPLPE